MATAQRCYDHRAMGARTNCAICARLAGEFAVVRKLVATLINAGYLVGVLDVNLAPTSDVNAVLANAFECDVTTLRVTKGAYRAAVLLVYGNDASEVIADYSTSLETVIAPVNAYMDSLA